MPEHYRNILKANNDIFKRRQRTKERLSEFKSKLSEALSEQEHSLSIFTAGSIGRSEVGEKSDIDPFFVAANEVSGSELSSIQRVVNEVANVTGFPDVTSEYFKVHSIENILTRTGKSDDDHENTFTTRVLMLLESVPIYNDAMYYEYRKQVIQNYFRDSRGINEEFRPVFLLNDFLRYWRTLCLNYEKMRDDPERPWRKKNINLKFARRFTIFSTILPMIALPISSVEEFVKICDMTPMERLAYGLDVLGDDSLKDGFKDVLCNYEYFLKVKETDEVESKLHEIKPRIKDLDALNRKFLFDALMHENVRDEYKHILVM
jgi:predicted nucleotidyltransferase